MVDPRTRIARDVLDGLHTSRVSLPLFQQHIPKRVAAEDHIGHGMVAGDAGSDLHLARSYAGLTDEVLTRLAER